jgi:hypothetical protein
VAEGKPVLLPVYPPHIPHAVPWEISFLNEQALDALNCYTAVNSIEFAHLNVICSRITHFTTLTTHAEDRKVKTRHA